MSRRRNIRRPSQRRDSLTLTLLPSEVIRQTLSNLDWRTLLTLRLVCKFLCSMVDKSPPAQYLIELAISGLEDNKRSSQLTTASRLALLKERNTHWNTLQWVESRDLPLLQDDDEWQFCGGVLAQSNLLGTMRLYQLPSQYRNIPARSWRIPILSNTEDFTMDPAQDLLVLVEKPILIPAHNNTKSYMWIRIHPRSLTTGHAHPSAVKVIDYRLYMQSAKLEMELSIQTCTKFLAILFIVEDNTSELTLWNWQTGESILRSSSLEIATFAFLTPQLLLVGTVMDETGVTEPRLFVLDISKPSTKKVALTNDCVCVFGFPSFDFVVSPVTILIRSDPSPGCKPNSEAHVPFSIAHGQRLFLITTWVEEKQETVSYDLFVPENVLLSSVMALPPQTRRHVINWNEWGPTGTRFLKSPPHPHVWTGNVFGSKFVSFVTDTAGRSSQTLQIWDFNQLAIKRAAALGFEKENTRLVNDTTVIKDKAFARRVRTSLPYTITTRTLPPPRSPGEPTFTNAMLDEDTIVLVNCDYRRLRVLTF
ncbi:hypothetical protein BDR06DRAFT_918460 [Suillus hirtellus]|nr:hypothetical protein BDR06DRAFT_918460 [Suillus hirtellus]